MTLLVAGPLLALVLLDRAAALVAASVARRRLAVYVDIARSLRVRMRGVPFLTQLLRGRYRDVRITGEGVELGAVTEGRLDAALRGARLPLRAVLRRTARELPVARLDADVLLPYVQLPRLARIAGLTVHPDGGALAVEAPLRIPGVGDVVRVSGRGELTLVDGTVRLTVSKLRVAGVALPGMVVAQLSRALAATVAVPQLPYGLRIVGLDPRVDGLAVRCTASDVVLRALPVPSRTG